MSINHKELSKALSVLASAPGKIAEAQEKCRQQIAAVDAKDKNLWAPATLERERAAAREERDRVCHALARSMRPALETVKANNSLADEPLDINDPKIQNAVNVISLMGKNLTYTDQISMLESFRGNPAALRFIQSAFKKNGMSYAAEQAGEMMRPISSRAIEEMSEVLAFHDYAEIQGRLDFPIERARWTKGEFQRQYDRMGYNPDTKADPYSYALDEAMNGLKEREFDVLSEADPEQAAKAKAWIAAQKLKIAVAQRDVTKAKESGGDIAEAFNRAMKAVESAEGVEA
jgi:hypothetical protein